MLPVVLDIVSHGSTQLVVKLKLWISDLWGCLIRRKRRLRATPRVILKPFFVEEKELRSRERVKMDQIMKPDYVFEDFPGKEKRHYTDHPSKRPVSDVPSFACVATVRLTTFDIRRMQ